MIELRPYQKEGINQIFEEWRSGKRSVLFQMPTGTGKTVLFNEITRRGSEGDRRILIVAHRKELIEQTKKLLDKIAVESGVIMAGHKEEYSHLVQVASIQTLARRENVPDPNLIIIDEAHHAKAKSYKALWERFPEAKFLGVTATPTRLSGEGFEDLFDVLVSSPSIKHFISCGFLAKVRHFVGPTPNLKRVKISKGDFATKQLAEVMAEVGQMASLTESYRKHASGKSMIVFAVDVAHSKSIVEQYRDIGVPAEHLDAKTPKDLRSDILNRFRGGKIKVISNVEIITEGFDFPACGCVQLARPTQSLALYLQMVGRVMRPAANKDSGIVLDNAGLWRMHGLVTKDRKWKLSGKKQKGRKKSLEEEMAFLNEEGIIQPGSPHYPAEVEGLEMIEMTEAVSRLLDFENFLANALWRDHKLVSSYYKYKEFVREEYGTFLSKEELLYIKNRLDKLNGQLNESERYRPGIWYHQSKELEKYWSGKAEFMPKESQTPTLKKKAPGRPSLSPRPDSNEWRPSTEYVDLETNYEREYEIFYSKDGLGRFPEPDIIIASSKSEAQDKFYERHDGCWVEAIREIPPFS